MTTLQNTNISLLISKQMKNNAGNDTFFHSTGIQSIDGGAGTDTLIVDYSKSRTSMGGVIGSVEGESFAGNVANYEGAQVDFVNIERVQIKSGSGDDGFAVFANAFFGSKSVAIDGGKGHDSLLLDVAAISTDTNFVVQGNSVKTNRGDYKNFEEFNITSGAGNDTLIAGSGDDYLSAGDGNDLVIGGAGNDHLSAGLGRNTLCGGEGDDVIGSFYEQSGVDIVDGGSGFDIWSGKFDSRTTSLNVLQTCATSFKLSNGTSLSGIEKVLLETGSGDDTISISGSNFSFYAGQGKDSFLADNSKTDLVLSASIRYSASSHFYGQMQDATGTNSASFYDVEFLNLKSGAQDDGFSITYDDDPGTNQISVDGGAGFDELSFTVAANSPGLNFVVTGNSIVSSRDHFANFEKFTISTADSNDTVTTGASDDIINTSGGNDILNGGAGRDYLSAGSGEDVLNGGLGDDGLSGGLGADQFQFTNSNFGNDSIFDFEDGVDKIVISADVADAFSDLSIFELYAQQSKISIGDNSVYVSSNAPLTLSAEDFIFM